MHKNIQNNFMLNHLTFEIFIRSSENGFHRRIFFRSFSFCGSTSFLPETSRERKWAVGVLLDKL